MTEMSEPAHRRLLVLRHGDSATPAHTPDQLRPLRHAGQWQATWVGGHCTERGWRPDIVLASPALRAQQSLEAFCAGGDHTPERRIEPTLYDGDRQALTDLVHGLPDRLGTCMLVGHNPAVSGFVLALGGDDVAHFPRLDGGMRPGMLAVLAWSGGWTDLEDAALEDVVWAGAQPS